MSNTLYLLISLISNNSEVCFQKALIKFFKKSIVVTSSVIIVWSRFSCWCDVHVNRPYIKYCIHTHTHAHTHAHTHTHTHTHTHVYRTELNKSEVVPRCHVCYLQWLFSRSSYFTCVTMSLSTVLLLNQCCLSHGCAVKLLRLSNELYGKRTLEELLN